MAFVQSRNSNGSLHGLEKAQLLLVNQSKEVAQLIQSILQALGFRHIYTASDALEAIRYLRELRINLMVTDSCLAMPFGFSADNDNQDGGLNGFEFVHRLRHSPSSPNPFVPVIMLAAKVDELECMQARDCGVNGVVLRPLEARQLCGALRDVIGTPRRFVVAESYRGPCRRRQDMPFDGPERRRVDICIIRNM